VFFLIRRCFVLILDRRQCTLITGHDPSAGPAEDDRPPLPGLIGTSDAMRQVFRLTRRAARSDASVLLLGETGTGKELIAKALHSLSARSGGPLVRVNCGALPETLLESELFGHVRGSFTDASRDRTGRFEAAHTGTIFLDEINSTSSFLQVKLLRVLQEREFERVGASKSIKVDVRVVAASNCILQKEVDEGRFRADLYWRLNVIPIHIPPLRWRRDDIAPLVRNFLHVYNQANNGLLTSIHPDAMHALQEYNWPGNVRELQNYIERAVVMADGEELNLDLLPEVFSGGREQSATTFKGADNGSLIEEFVHNGIASANGDAEDLHARIVDPVERELIVQVMRSCKQVRIQAAKRLGINRNTLKKKLEVFGIESDSDED
jgi:transcriptional regulator with PAS, ATPase and Fis domain